jgi:hypothetical protein
MSPIVAATDDVFRFGIIGDLHTYRDDIDPFQFAA